MINTVGCYVLVFCAAGVGGRHNSASRAGDRF